MSIHIILPFPLMSFPWKPRKWILYTCLLFPVECGWLPSHPFNNHFWVPAFVPLAVPGQAGWSTKLMCRCRSLFLLSRNSQFNDMKTRWGHAEGAAERALWDGKLKKGSALLKVESQWLFFEKVWESWSGSVEKTSEGCVLKEFQATWFYNTLQLILKGKRSENNLYIQEKKPWGNFFPTLILTHPPPSPVPSKKSPSINGWSWAMAPTPPPPSTDSHSLSPLVHATCEVMTGVLPHSSQTDRASTQPVV